MPVGSRRCSSVAPPTGTCPQSTEINWQAPNTGTYASPILGYKIQMKQLCSADVAGTLISDSGGTAIDYQTSTVYDCAGTYSTGFTEPVTATASTTSLGSWVDVTGVYTPTSGQNHDAACAASCATTSCSVTGTWANEAAILHTTTGCSGCAPQNPEADVGCFPGADGYPTTVGVVHRIGGLTISKYYTFRIAAFNHFGTGAWSTQSYAVHTHSAPTAPTWATAPVTSVAAAGTGVTLNWAAGDAYGTGTDDCATRGAAHTMTATVSCSRPQAEIFAECDTDHDAAISSTEASACACISATGTPFGIADVTFVPEPCSTAGYGVADAGSETSSGAHSYTVQQCSGSGCTPLTTTYTTSSTTQAVTGLTAGTTYVFKVTATNAAGSTASGTTSYTTPAVPAQPDPPVAVSIDGTEIKMSWLASIDKVISTVTGHNTVGCTACSNGFILYAQSYDMASSTWVTAVRGSLTHDGGDTIAAMEYSLGRAASASNPDVAYGSDSDSTVVTLTDSATGVTGSWLKLAYFSNEYYQNAASAETAKTTATATWNQRGLTNRVDVVDTVVVPSLLAGTNYRFKVAFVNEAGTSVVSDVSQEYTTTDSSISSLRIYSGPPCVYKPGQGGVTTFAASAEGSNVKYTWELVSESTTGQSTMYSDSTMRPGGSTVGTCKDGAKCSVMEYNLPYPGDDSTAQANYDEVKLRVLASNGRGIVAEEIAFGYNTLGRSQLTGVNTIEYCGCTDPGDDLYWAEATYMVPSLCTTDTFDSADTSSVGSSNVAANDWEYFQFFFDADSYAAEVTVRVDVGTVDIYVSTSEIPDAALAHTYSKSKTGVSNFFVASLPYTELSTSAQRSVFVAVKGAAGFSRFQVLGRSSEFQLAPGSDSPTPATRERLQDITTTPAGITKTVVASGWNFFEFYYPHADNDIDVQLTVTSTTASTTAVLNVYTSLEERYPSPLRATSTSSGYWTGTGHSATDISATAAQSLTYTIRPTSHTGTDGALYVGVQGEAASTWVVGEPLPSSTYTITAKVFRYSIMSSLLDPVADARVSTVTTGTTLTGFFAATCADACTQPTLPATANTVDDFYIGMVITIAGESRTISDYVGSTKVITVSEAFTSGQSIGTATAFTIVVSGTDAVTRAVTAEDRYSVASTDNFNYYEVVTSDATKSLTLTLTVHYGTAKLFTSPTTLPTQDTTVSTALGDAGGYSASSTANTITIAASSTNIEGKYVYLGVFASGGDTSYDLVVTENTFGVAAPTQLYFCAEGTDVRSYTTSTVAVDAACTTLPGAATPVCDDAGTTSTAACPLCTDAVATLSGLWAAGGSGLALPTTDANGRTISAVNDFYNGMVITTSADSGESRVITDYDGSSRVVTLSSAFTTANPNGATASFTLNPGFCEPSTCKCSAGNTLGADVRTTIADNDGAGHFFALYVGTEDAQMQTASRSGTGTSTSDISTSSSGWGLDWTMPMTNTWIDSKTDQWDMDVDIAFTRAGLQTGASQDFRVFASTRERYPSDERAYDTAVASASVHYDASTMYSQAGLAGKGFATTGTGACALLVAESTVATYGVCLAACDTLAGTQTGALTQVNGAIALPAGVASSLNYYAGWTIVTVQGGATSAGTILTSGDGTDTTPAITISWLPAGSTVTAGGTTHSGSSTVPTVHASATTFTLYPPSTSTTLCNAAQFTTTGTKCQLYTCPSSAASYLVADETTDQAYLKSSDASSLVLPHYTFSGQWVYINIENSETLTGHLQISKTEKTSSRSVSTDPTAIASGCTSAFCNYNGNCIDDSTDGEHKTPYCICSDGYSGADCSVEAFSTATTVATSSSFKGSVATGYEYGSVKSGGGTHCTTVVAGCMSITNAFSADLTLLGSVNHATSADYYKGWSIVVSGLVHGEGVIATSSAADPPVITVTWASTAHTPATTPTTTSTYTITTNKEVGTMSAALTLQASNQHSTAVDYYKGWTIATLLPTGSGTILTNNAAGLLTVDWTTAVITTTSTTYTLTPPTQCNTGNAWQANGESNAALAFVSAGVLHADASAIDDYYNGMTLTVASGAGLSIETGTFGTVAGTSLTLQTGNSHYRTDSYYVGWTVTVSGGTGVVATSTAANPPIVTVTWTGATPTLTTSTTYTLTHPGYTVTDYVGSTKIITTAPALPTLDNAGGSFPTTSYVIAGCKTGHKWIEGSKTCTRYTGGDQHVWEPFVYIGVGALQHCTPIENLVVATTVDACRALCNAPSESGTMSAALSLQASNAHSTVVSYYIGWTITTGTPIASGTGPIVYGTGDDISRGVEVGTITSYDGSLAFTVTWQNEATVPTLTTSTTYTLTPPASACNAFTHEVNAECSLYTCPTATAPVTTEALTKAGSWGVDAEASHASYYKEPLTCCAGSTDWKVAPSCSTPVPGYYDEASCTTVQGITTAPTCEQVAASDKATCENAPATAVEATCELKPFDEVPESLCSPAAIRAGYDGSTTAKSCDAFDVVKLDCSTQKCTPSASTANPYKIGYVTCPGGICTINAAKPIVTIPFTVAGLPQYSKVLTYVDSQPYPAKGANSVHYTYNCEASDAPCVAKGAHSESTCTETATVSVSATYTACAAESGGTKADCEAVVGCTYTAATTTTPHFADSSIKIYDMEPLPSGKKHTLVMMLLTDDGEPLGTVLKQFEVGYAGGCTVAPDGSVCGGKGACNLGYCVCHDGYFGTTCERNVDEDGSVCAAQSSSSSCLAADGNGASPGFGNYNCLWSTTTSLCSISVVTTGFTAGGVYEARQTSMAANKLGEARFLNTRMLEANAAEITKSDSALTAGTAGTKTKLETVAATVVATVAASKTATQTNVDLLYAKAERNQIKVQQAKEESLRLQTTNLEAKLEMQRSLADHQTQVQNRFQSKRFDVYKLNALKQDKLKQEFARTRFTLNQLLTSNGPTVDPTKFKESTCTTDQFYNVNCVETTTDKSSSFAGTGYVSDQLVDLGTTVGTSTAPVVAISGEDVAGTYSDVDRGR